MDRTIGPVVATGSALAEAVSIIDSKMLTQPADDVANDLGKCTKRSELQADDEYLKTPKNRFFAPDSDFDDDDLYSMMNHLVELCTPLEIDYTKSDEQIRCN